MKHIDLYHKEFHPYRTPPLVRGLQLGALLLVLIGASGYLWHSSRTEQLQTRLQSVESTRDQLNSELTLMQQRLEAQQSDPRMQRRADSLRQKLKIQRPLFETLEGLNALRGYSVEILTALAQQQLPEVWFTRIELDTTAARIILEGSGSDPERISAAVDTLMTKKVFGGQEFSHLQIQRDEEGLYTFSLASHLNPQEERP